MKAQTILSFLSLLLSLRCFAQAQVEDKDKSSASTSMQSSSEEESGEKTWGAFDPGKGFLVGKTPYGTLSISGYTLVRFLDQLPADQNFTDHLGRTTAIDTRLDIQSHRFMVWLKGWMYDPKLTYSFLFWGLNSTNDTANVAAFNYEINKAVTFGAGIEAVPGVRSLTGQHPYFLGTDRQLAEEFFKPSFTSGIWLRGEALPGLNYRVMAGNNLSTIGINAAQMTRDLAIGASVWWYPTTGEFGPRGGFGDYEMHEKPATRVGFSVLSSRESRQAQSNGASENTQVRLSDGLLLFNPDSLAPGVTVEKVNFRLLSVDGALKYRGFFLHGEYFARWLNDFIANGPLPLDSMFDQGFWIAPAYQILPKKLELYGSLSIILGKFNHSSEVAIGSNYYPFDTRNFRINSSVSYLEHSAVGSLFGYYVAGQTGPLISIGADLLF